MNRFLSLKTPAIVVGALVFGALCAAQGGARQGRGFGGGFGGGRGNTLGLLRRSDVQTDLQLSADQKSKIDDLMTSMRGQRGNRGDSAGQAGQAGTPPTEAQMEARRADMESRRAEMQKKIDAILTQSQLGRLKEISIQLRGNMAVMDPDVQKEIGLSSDQQSKIKDLSSKMRDAMTSVMEKMRSQEITRDQAMDAFKKNNQAMQDEIGKLLTASQTSKLKAMGGAPFKADPAESQGFGFGGGRGGRRGGGGGL